GPLRPASLVQVARRQGLDDRVIVVDGQAELLQVVDALRPARRLAGRLHGRQQQGNQDGDDGDDDQKLDQRESSPTATHGGPPGSGVARLHRKKWTLWISHSRARALCQGGPRPRASRFNLIPNKKRANELGRAADGCRVRAACAVSTQMLTSTIIEF